MKTVLFFISLYLGFNAYSQNPKNALPGNSNNSPVKQTFSSNETNSFNNFNKSKNVGGKTKADISKPGSGRGSNSNNWHNGPRGGGRNNTGIAKPDFDFNLPFFVFSNPFNFNNINSSVSYVNKNNTDCRTCVGSRWFIGASVNASIPVGKFNIDHPQSTSYAKTGINVEMDVHYYFLRRLNTGILFSLNKNSYTNPLYESFIYSRIPSNATNINTQFNPWDSYNIMWSLGYSQPVWKNIAINFRGNVGLNITEFPKANSDYMMYNNTYRKEYGSTGFGWVYGGGLAINYYFSPCVAAFVNVYGYHTKVQFKGLNEKTILNDVVQREEKISEPFQKEHTWLVVGGGVKFTIGK